MIEFAVRSACGSKHGANEDRALIGRSVLEGPFDAGRLLSEQGSERIPCVMAVFDGVGGYAFGGEAARVAAEGLSRSFFASDAEGKTGVGAFDARLDCALVAANAAVVAAQDEGSEVGFTAAAGIAFDRDGTARLFHAGDVRVYLCRDSKAVRLTKDHSLAEMLRDCNAVDETSAGVAHVITRYLGGNEETACWLGEDEEGARPRHPFEVSPPIEVLPGDVYLVCSDGLWEFLNDDDIVSALEGTCEGGSLTSILDGWAETALAKGAYDDMTAVVLKMR